MNDEIRAYLHKIIDEIPDGADCEISTPMDVIKLPIKPGENSVSRALTGQCSLNLSWVDEIVQAKFLEALRG